MTTETKTTWEGEERPFWRIHDDCDIKIKELPNGRVRVWCAWSHWKESDQYLKDNKVGTVKCVVESIGLMTKEKAEELMETSYESGQFVFKGASASYIHRSATERDVEYDLES